MRDNSLLFGTAYYPEYMPYERTDKDIEMMAQAGMNVIRIAESTWSTLEPVEGTFDFSYIDRIVKATAKVGMSVIIGTPTYAIPAWLAKKDADIMVRTKDGQAVYGRRQIYDLLNPTFLFYAERVIRKLAEHTAPMENVIGFQIDNETKHYGNDGQRMQQSFIAYLQEKFPDIEDLNKTFYLNYWSNAIHDWNDFPDMCGCVNAGLAGEYEAFRRSVAAKYLSWQASIIREYKRENQFITHNLDFDWKKFGADIAQDGYSYGVQGDINHYEVSKCLDIVGTDIYHPTQDELTGAEIAFCGDSIRSLKGQNYLVLESQAQAFKYWTPYPKQLKLHAYSHLASGACGVMYWNWHSIHNGYETYWRGILSHDLQRNRVYEEIAAIGAEWKQYGAYFRGLHKKNRIAFLVDNRSMTAMKWFPVDGELSYNDIVRWMYDSLYECNLECDVIDVSAWEEPSDLGTFYDMIVTPGLYCASETLIQLLDTFVKKGGVLVSSFRSFVADSYASVYADALPHGLTKCFGMTYQEFTEPGKTMLSLDGSRLESLLYYMELLKLQTAESMANYQHKYWGIYAAITQNAYGNGMAYYMGCYSSKDILKQVLTQAAERAGISRKRERSPIIIRDGINAQGKTLHFVLHYEEETWQMRCPYEDVVELFSGRHYGKGEEIILEDWDVKILIE